MNRNAFIAAEMARARANYAANVNSAANEAFGSNNNLNARAAEAAANENFNTVNNIQLQRAMKNSFKQEAVARILQTLKNSAQAENARIYGNTKNVLLSEPKNQRQTVLKIAALDDIMIEERKKLATASRDETAREAAGRLYDVEKLKEELDDARHKSEVPTPEQEARYTALIAGVDFNSLNSSLYKRLVANNAEKTRKNNENAAAAAAKAKANANAFAAAPMVPINLPPAPKGHTLGATAAPKTREELRAARLAAMGKRGGKRGSKRSGKTRKYRSKKH